MGIESLAINYRVILPEIILAATGIVLMLVDAFAPNERKIRAGVISLVGLAAALLVTWQLRDIPPQTAFAGMVIVDGFRVLFTLIVVVGAMLSVLLAWNFLDEERIQPTEYYALIMFCAVGMAFLASSHDLIMVFLGMETVTISTYVLAGYRRDDVRSTEAALKYFILGAFSSAFLIYGIALIYGATRTTNLAGIQAALNGAMGEPERALMLAGAAMLLIGFGFKVTTVPFHIWTPDVYEGSPTPVTAFLSAATKAAGFAAFLRVFSLVFGLPFTPDSAGSMLQSHWVSALSVMSILTMTIANLIAITQTNIKRMLAYSSIAHAGYVLMGLVARDWKAVAFYMLAYTIMNLGAFAVVALIARRHDEKVLIEDYHGLGFRQPGLSFPLTVFLISLTGIPGTAGFVGKFWLFKSAWEAGFPVLVIAAVINTVVAAYYYLYVVIVMFFREPKRDIESVPLPRVFALTLALTVFGTFYLGLLPERVFQFLNAAQTAVAGLIR
ncbi:MAG: NADH-quinone oxidoreductase subunit N [Acidobacteriota bacterium]|nr:NADH-quinone oxidoreductase subunit N [Acidobacteriota bacterium]